MRFPFLASFIVFILWLAYEISKARNVTRKREKEFWEREARANNTRRKSLDDLNYIKIPLSSLPLELCKEDEEIGECVRLISELAGQTIVNLTNYSNTDLKLMYGAPNLTLLTEYDQNYTLLARTLQQWASLLYDRGYTAQARQILEFAVSTRTDISGTYKLLGQIYQAENNGGRIKELIQTAETLDSSMKNSIVQALLELYLSCG